LLDDLLTRQPNFAPALIERGTLAVRAGQPGSRRNAGCGNQQSSTPGDLPLHYQLFQVPGRLGNTRGPGTDSAPQTNEDDIQRIQVIVGVQMQQNPHDADLHFEAGMI